MRSIFRLYKRFDTGANRFEEILLYLRIIRNYRIFKLSLDHEITVLYHPQIGHGGPPAHYRYSASSIKLSLKQNFISCDRAKWNEKIATPARGKKNKCMLMHPKRAFMLPVTRRDCRRIRELKFPAEHRPFAHYVEMNESKNDSASVRNEFLRARDYPRP